MNEIIIQIDNTSNANRTAMLFHSLLSQNYIGDNAAIVPLQSIEGIEKVLTQTVPAGNADVTGTIGFNSNGDLVSFPTGVSSVKISSQKYPYYSLLEYIKTESILLGSVKMESANISQLTVKWNYAKSFPNGQTYNYDIDMDNIISPDQIQPNIRVVDLQKVIDKFTGFFIQILPLTTLKLTFNFSIAKK